MGAPQHCGAALEMGKIPMLSWCVITVLMAPEGGWKWADAWAR